MKKVIEVQKKPVVRVRKCNGGWIVRSLIGVDWVEYTVENMKNRVRALSKN